MAQLGKGAKAALDQWWEGWEEDLNTELNRMVWGDEPSPAPSPAHIESRFRIGFRRFGTFVKASFRRAAGVIRCPWGRRCELCTQRFGETTYHPRGHSLWHDRLAFMQYHFSIYGEWLGDQGNRTVLHSSARQESLAAAPGAVKEGR